MASLRQVRRLSSMLTAATLSSLQDRQSHRRWHGAHARHRDETLVRHTRPVEVDTARPSIRHRMDNAEQPSGIYRIKALSIAPPGPGQTTALLCWSACIVGVAAHSLALFKRRRLDEAAAVTAGMVVASAVLVAAVRGVDRPAARAAVLLVAWVTFALYVQGVVWKRNRKR
jgi:hypothetical protein